MQSNFWVQPHNPRPQTEAAHNWVPGVGSGGARATVAPTQGPVPAMRRGLQS